MGMGWRAGLLGRALFAVTLPAAVGLGAASCAHGRLAGLPGAFVGLLLVAGALAAPLIARRTGSRHTHLLVDAGAALASSFDQEEMLRELRKVVVANIADCCVVYMVDDNGGIAPPEVTTSLPARQAAAEALARQPVEVSTPFLRDALMSDRALLVPRLEPARVAALTGAPALAAAITATDACSLLAVRLRARERARGVLVLMSTNHRRRYDTADVPVVEELARRTAMAIESARLVREATRAAQARDEVLAVVAHDLRSPLGGILLTLDLLEERLRERGAHDLLDPWVSGLQSSAREIDRGIQELLDITRLESGRIALQLRRLDPAQLVEQTVVAARAGTRPKRLVAEVARGLPAVTGDEERLMQILHNLIAESARFMTDESRAIIVGAERIGEQIRFAVTDPGSQTASDEMKHLFDRFWHPGFADRRGAALGLSIARALVGLHGGQIGAVSEPGEGTTFWFTVPVLTPTATEERAKAAEVLIES